MGTGDPLRVVVAGLGIMGFEHVKTVASVSRLRLAGICDVDAGNLESAGALADIPRYRDYAAMLDRERPDAVIVATPHYQHPGMATEALRRGMHVLVEKPVGVHGLEVRRSLAA